MAKSRTWEIKIDEKNYEIEFIQDFWFNNHKVFVNGEKEVYNKNIFKDYLGIDIPLTLGSKEVILVHRGNFTDISVDGVFWDSDEKYREPEKMNKWNLVFVFLCILLPLLTRGGAIPVLLAIVGIIVILRNSISPNIKNKILANFIVTLGIYAVVFLLILFVGLLGVLVG